MTPSRRIAARRRSCVAVALAPVAAATIAALGAPAPAHAAAATDGSVGPVQTLSGRFTVPQTLGTLRGGNLFHSFARFSIAPGESATFTTTDADIRHVVSRVTGGEASLLQGPLTLQAAAGSRPDFWFVNTSGITVGAGARFDVPAGLHLATAQQLHFADGSAWSTTGATGSSLSVAEPQAFGFLGGSAAAITLDQAALALRGRFTAAAGDLVVRESSLLGQDAPMRLVAVARAAVEVPVDGPLAGLAEAAASAGGGGALQIERSAVSTRGSAGIAATAASVGLVASELSTSQSGAGSGGPVLLAAGGAMSVVDSLVGTETLAGGNAGDLVVAARGRLAAVASQILSQTLGPGHAGAVQVSAGQIDIDGQDTASFAGIGSVAGRGSSGNAGAVTVTAQQGLRLAREGLVASWTLASGAAGPVGIEAPTVDINGSGIFSQSSPGSTGHGSTIVLRATGGRVRIVDGGFVSADTFGGGNAGSVVVQARDIEIVGDAAGDRFTGISSQANSGSSGRAGGVQVEASGALSVRRGGSVSSSTFAAGDAGEVRIRAGSVDIDGGGTDAATGIRSNAVRGSRGNAGTVQIESGGLLRIVQTGAITSNTFGSGNAGGVSVKARDIEIVGDPAADAGFTGIASRAGTGSSGRAGRVQVEATGALSVQRGGSVSSSTFGAGDGGDMRIRAGSIDIDGSGTDAGVGTGIASNASAGSRGHAGSVSVESGGLVRIVDGGDISSGTFGSGNAGGVSLTAQAVEIIGAASGDRFTGISSQANSGSSGRAGSVRVEASDALAVRRSGSVSSSTFAVGDAGDVRVSAGSIDIDGSGTDAVTGIGSNAYRGSRGNAGAVTVESGGLVRIVDGGDISSGIFDSGNSGGVVVRARAIEIVGDAAGERFTGISSQANAGSSGRAGSVRVEASDALAVRRGGSVSSSTFAAGDAGNVLVSAGAITIDGSGTDAGVTTGVASSAYRGSLGNAGSVTIESGGLVRIVQAGDISSSTFGRGNAGGVSVKARAIEVTGVAAGGRFTGIASQANAGSSGRAGSVRVEASDALAVRRGGTVSSGTFAAGDAGEVRIRAGSVDIDGSGTDAEVATTIGSSAFQGSRGNAGAVTIESGGLVRVVETGDISSSTFSSGHAGVVTVRAKDVEIIGSATEGAGFTGIASQANAGSSGHAGSVFVEASEGLAIRRSGTVSSSTFAAGAAGDVTIDAGWLQIDGSGVFGGRTGVLSQAASGSSGQAGSLRVQVRDALELRHGGTLSIAIFARVAEPSRLTPTTLTVAAGSLSLIDSNIFADASANTNASRLDLSVAGRVRLHNSSITTEANDGDGGPIRLRALDRVTLVDSSITTSVFGNRGNGGDIRIETPTLVLRSGFIQANTAAARAQGGDVRIDAPLLVPDGSNVFIGGNRVERVTTGVAGFNVIQAAAPEGLSGTLDVTLPQLSLSGALAGLSTARIDFGLLGRDACYADDDSSFTRVGRGALPPQASQPVRVAP